MLQEEGRTVEKKSSRIIRDKKSLPQISKRFECQTRLFINSIVTEWLTTIGGVTSQISQPASEYLCSEKVGVSTFSDLIFLDDSILSESGVTDETSLANLREWCEFHKMMMENQSSSIHCWLVSCMGLPVTIAVEYSQKLTGDDVGVTTFDDLFYLDDDLMESIGIRLIHRKKILCWLKANEKDWRRSVVG